MKIDRSIIISCFVLFSASLIQAQTITGKLTDEKGNPLSYANVVILSLPDSAFVNGSVSREDGTFTIHSQGKGQLVRITSTGYKPLYKSVTADMGVISLQPDTKMLGEVIVKSQLPKTRLRNGAMITNIPGTVLEKAGTVENLLDRIPNVTAKKGKIEVFGRGTPLIYINGRRMRDQSELDRLNSDNIKSVEVITTPGARYNADVTSVIRITTKKAVGEGLGIDSRTYVYVNDKADWGESENLNLNYRKGKMEMDATVRGANNEQRDDKTLEQITFLDKTWSQKQAVYTTNRMKALYTRLGLSYQFNAENSIGTSMSFNRHPEGHYSGQVSSEVRTDNLLTETSTSILGNLHQTTTWNGNAYYVGKVGNLGIDLNMDWYKNSDFSGDNTQESYTASGEPTQSQDIQTRTRKKNRLVAAKLVLTYPILGGEMGLGGEYSFSRRTTIYRALPIGIVDDDDSKTREGMTSAFLDYNRRFGPIDFHAGLRYEYVDFDYYEQGVRINDQSRTFSNLFPSVSLSMPVGKTEMQLSYSSDIKRPSYWELRSSVLYANRYTYETGNPFLLPTISRNLSYTFSWTWLTFSTIYAHVSNPQRSYGESYNGKPDIFLLTRINGATYNHAVASLSLSPKIGIWTPSFRAGIAKQWVDLQTHSGNKLDNPIATFRFNNTLTTKLCDITLLMTAQTEGSAENFQMTEGYFNTDLMLYKSFLKGQLLLQLYVSDLFSTADSHIRLFYGTQREMQYNTLNHPEISLTVRYKLNASKSKYKGTGAGQIQKSRM